MKKNRIIGLDIFRGVALLLMMMYHFTYDLNYFGFIHQDMNYNSTFLLIRYTIITIFLLSVGMSLMLVHQNGIRWHSIRKRIIQLGVASLVVSLATYFIFPTSWIYFGILHFILVASLMILPLLHFPKTVTLIAILILVGSATKIIGMEWLFNLLQAPLHLPPYTEDLVPLVPWVAVVLLGINLVQYNLHHQIFSTKIFTLNTLLHRTLKRMGQHSLAIYLIHQGVFFGAFELYFMLFSK